MLFTQKTLKTLEFDKVAELTFGSDEENLTAVHNETLQEVAGITDLVDCLGNVDDGDAALGCVNILFHLGVPTFGLMSEMTSRFEQIFNCDRHF